MANLKFQQINGGTTTLPLAGDIFPYVTDPLVVPLDRQTTITGLFASAQPITINQAAVSGAVNGYSMTIDAGTHTNWNPPASATWDQKFDNTRTVTFADAVGDQFGIISHIITSPTYAYTSVNHEILFGITNQIQGIPKAGANCTLDIAVGQHVGDLVNPYVTNALDGAGQVIQVPGISDGIGDTDGRSGVSVGGDLNNQVILGNQTAVMQNLIGFDVGNFTAITNAGTRTVQGAIAGCRATAPVAGSGVVFSTTSYAFYASQGLSYFPDGIVVNTNNAAAPGFAFNNDFDTGLFSKGAGFVSFTSNGVDAFSMSYSTSYSRLSFNGKFSLQDETIGSSYIDFDTSVETNGRFILKNFTTLEISTGQVIKRSPVAASYSVQLSDYLIGVTSTAAPRLITLPTAASATTGRIYVVKDESGGAGTNNITVDVSGGGLIDGVATQVININYGSLQLYTNGINWFIY